MNQHNKHKNFLFKYLSQFISASIYLLMLFLAIFIFYKIILLIYFVWDAAIVEIIKTSSWEMNFIEWASGDWVKLIEIFLSHITFVLILVKAFRILESYAKHHHIEITDLVEIAIIALIMEVVFNFAVHSNFINILFGCVWIALLIIYVHFPYFRDKENNV